MEVEKLRSVLCCISSNQTKTDLDISRWDGIPTFPVVCMDLLRRLKLRGRFFQYCHSAKFAIKNKTSFTYYNSKVEKRFQIKLMGLVQRIDGSVVKYVIMKTEYDVIWGVEGKDEFRCKAGMCNTACVINCRRVGK